MTAVHSELRADFEREIQPAHRSAAAHSMFGPLRSHARLYCNRRYGLLCNGSVCAWYTVVVVL